MVLFSFKPRNLCTRKYSKKNKSDFWKHVQFGGGLGLGFGSGYTDVMVAQVLFTTLNQYVALGLGHNTIKIAIFINANMYGEWSNCFIQSHRRNSNFN